MHLFLLYAFLFFNLVSADNFVCKHPEYLPAANVIRNGFEAFAGSFNHKNLNGAFKCFEDNGEVTKIIIFECLSLVGLPDVDLVDFYNRRYLMSKKDTDDLSCCVGQKLRDTQKFNRSLKQSLKIYKECLEENVSVRELSFLCSVYKVFPGVEKLKEKCKYYTSETAYIVSK